MEEDEEEREEKEGRKRRGKRREGADAVARMKHLHRTGEMTEQS